MNSAIERLIGLRVKDVMNHDVLSVSQSEEMLVAAKKLHDAEVTGAPVVNELGVCVGVLSSRDFVGWKAGCHDKEVMVRSSPDEPYHIECLDDDVVSSHMSPLVQTISNEATILSAARVMCNEGIHRLVVVDDRDRPIGIVSTLDLVASMVAAIEEPN